jgi:uncharacterized protein
VIPTIWETVAGYAHLRNLHDKAWYIAALASWGIALFEYLLQVPANRLGYGVLNLARLKSFKKSSLCRYSCHSPCSTCTSR